MDSIKQCWDGRRQIRGRNGRGDGFGVVARCQRGKFQEVLRNINLGFQRKVRTEDHNTRACKGSWSRFLWNRIRQWFIRVN